MSTATRGCVIARTRCRQYSLFNSNFCSSLQDVVFGESINRSTGRKSLNMPKTARLRNLSVAFIRRMCPTHTSLLTRTHFTRSKVHHFADASWCDVLPVMILTILTFTPFSAAATSAVIVTPQSRTLEYWRCRICISSSADSNEGRSPSISV